jgi:perosamine synthetase
MTISTGPTLAIHGGEPVRREPWPARRLFGPAEKAAVMRLFDEAVDAGEAFGYEGPHEGAYTRAFAAAMGGGYADGVNSGTTALYVALRALDLPKGAQVVVPAITDPGGVMPVVICGCEPVPADTAPMSYNVGAAQVKSVLNDRTAAIVVAHIAGQPCDIGPIVDLAASHGLPLIEDCAQAHGATYDGKHVGTFGSLAAFSTMFAKHHATGGQGGVVFTRDEALYWKARRAADRGKPHGLAGQPQNVIASLNFNMDELHAAIGQVQLARLPQVVARRQELTATLAEACRRRLRSVRVVESFPDAPCGRGSHLFVFLRFDETQAGVDKETFVRAARAEGIPFEVSYLPIPCRQPWYVEQFGRDWPLPNAHATDRVHFNWRAHEACGPREVEDTVRALEKVEAAFVH